MATQTVEFTVEKLQTPQGVAELNRVLNLLLDAIPSDFNDRRIIQGYATPEGAVVAGVGSIFMRLDGGTSTSIYVKESGTGATGWRAL